MGLVACGGVHFLPGQNGTLCNSENIERTYVWACDAIQIESALAGVKREGASRGDTVSLTSEEFLDMETFSIASVGEKKMTQLQGTDMSFTVWLMSHMTV